jgi:hypothetical protein
VPTETLTRNERVVPEQAAEVARSPEDKELRTLARQHLEDVRKFKLLASIYVLSLLVLVPVWVVEQYETSPGWLKHLSTRSRYPGDWDPWIIWVALVGGAIVAFAGLRAYVFGRGPSEAEVDREIERLKSKR